MSHRWPFHRKPTDEVEVEESKRVLAEALARRARTRRVARGIERAIIQNHFTADIETVMEGRR